MNEKNLTNLEESNEPPSLPDKKVDSGSIGDFRDTPKHLHWFPFRVGGFHPSMVVYGAADALLRDKHSIMDKHS